MSPHPWTNFETQKDYEKEPRCLFKGVYSRNNLSKIKYRAYIINLDEYESLGTHWSSLYANAKTVTYFDSFGVEHVSQEIKKFIGNKDSTTNVYRIKAYDSIMSVYFCIGFTDLMLKGKSLLEYTNLFSSNDYEKNYKIIIKYFQ